MMKKGLPTKFYTQSWKIHICTLRQYFSLYRAVSQRGRKKREKIDERKNVQPPHPHLLQSIQDRLPEREERTERGRESTDESKNVQTTPPAPTASTIGPCPTAIQIVGRPGTRILPSTIAPKGWLSGAKVLGELPVPRRPTYFDYSRASAYCACSRCGWRGCLDIFSVIYRFSLLSPSLWETA